MGNIRGNLIRLLGGVPFEDYSKGLEEYKEFCNKLLKKWEEQQAYYISSIKEPIGLKASCFMDKAHYNKDSYNAAKEDILKDFMAQIDKNNLLTMCATTNTEDDIVRIDAWMRVVPPQ